MALLLGIAGIILTMSQYSWETPLDACNVLEPTCGCSCFCPKTTTPSCLTPPPNYTEESKQLLFLSGFAASGDNYLVSRSGMVSRIALNAAVRNVDCDAAKGLLFFSDFDGNSVWKFDTEASSETKLVTLQSTTRGIGADKDNELIFISVTNTGIYCIDYDGNNLYTIIDTDHTVSVGLQADSAERWLYWTDYNNGALEKINYSNLNQPTDRTIITDQLNQPSALLLDKSGDQLFMLLASGEIWRMSLSDNSDIAPIISAPSGTTNARSLQIFDGKFIYFDYGIDKLWSIVKTESNGNNRIQFNNKDFPVDITGSPDTCFLF